MAPENESIVLQPGEGEMMSVVGNELTLKAVSEDTGDAFSIMEYTAGPGFGGPPLHVHRKMIETFYVLEGELTLRVGERTVVLAPGGFVLVSTGTAHTFSNPGTVPTKFLLVISPAGFEKYFEELHEAVAERGYPPPAAVMMALGQKYDFEPAGPPLGS